MQIKEFIIYEVTNNKKIQQPIQLTLKILVGTGLATATAEMSQSPAEQFCAKNV